jgi:hypothetical protein
MFYPNIVNEIGGKGKSLIFPYFSFILYDFPKDKGNIALDIIRKHLYIAIKAEDIKVSAVC